MSDLAQRNAAALMQALDLQNGRIAILETQFVALTNHVQTLLARMEQMHQLQAKALQEKYRGRASGRID